MVGDALGDADGVAEGVPVVGVELGEPVGSRVGDAVGSADGASVLVALTAVKRATPVAAAATLDMARFGFESAATRRFRVCSMPVDGGPDVPLGEFPGGAVELSVALGVRAVELLRVDVAA